MPTITGKFNLYKNLKQLQQVSKFFIYQLMHKRIALKRILKFTLKQLWDISVQSPLSESALFESLLKLQLLK